MLQFTYVLGLVSIVVSMTQQVDGDYLSGLAPVRPNPPNLWFPPPQNLNVRGIPQRTPVYDQRYMESRSAQMIKQPGLHTYPNRVVQPSPNAQSVQQTKPSHPWPIRSTSEVNVHASSDDVTSNDDRKVKPNFSSYMNPDDDYEEYEELDLSSGEETSSVEHPLHGGEASIENLAHDILNEVLSENSDDYEWHRDNITIYIDGDVITTTKKDLWGRMYKALLELKHNSVEDPSASNVQFDDAKGSRSLDTLVHEYFNDPVSSGSLKVDPSLVSEIVKKVVKDSDRIKVLDDNESSKDFDFVKEPEIIDLSASSVDRPAWYEPKATSLEFNHKSGEYLDFDQVGDKSTIVHTDPLLGGATEGQKVWRLGSLLNNADAELSGERHYIRPLPEFRDHFNNVDQITKKVMTNEDHDNEFVKEPLGGAKLEEDLWNYKQRDQIYPSRLDVINDSEAPPSDDVRLTKPADKFSNPNVSAENVTSSTGYKNNDSVTTDNDGDDSHYEGVFSSKVAGFPSITSMAIDCTAAQLRVTVVFDNPFAGTVYTQATQSEESCPLVAYGSNRNTYTFHLDVDHCGVTALKGPVGTLLDAKVMFQHLPNLLGPWDSMQHLQCQVPTIYKAASLVRHQSRSLPPRMDYLYKGYDLGYELSVRKTHNPFGSVATSINLGEPLTLTVTMSQLPEALDKSLDLNFMDMLVTNCIAYSPDRKFNLPVTDDRGCIVANHLFSRPVYRLRSSYGDSVSMDYIHFLGFRFPGYNTVNFECDVNLCYGSCQHYCSEVSPLSANAPILSLQPLDE